MTLVVKLGSSLVAGPGGSVRRAVLRRRAREIAAIVAGGEAVVVVSSGAIALGLPHLGLERRPRAVPKLQAASALGQARLQQAWERALAREGLQAAQILLTAADVADRAAYVNARNALEALFALGAVPIVNENDATATDEIAFGDNDALAAQVAILVRARLLVLLTEVDGVYTRAPGRPGAELVQRGVSRRRRSPRRRVEARTRRACEARCSPRGWPPRPGSRPSSPAARRAAVLEPILAGEPRGTRFHGASRELSAYKLWLRFAKEPVREAPPRRRARSRAVADERRSLLAVGVARCEGRFDAGDAVELVGPDGDVFAKGVASASADEIARARGGCRSRAPRPSRRVLIARGRERARPPCPGLADSLERLGTETAFSVLARARELERQGREIIHLEIGEPDFDTPLHVRDAAAAALARRARRTTARPRASRSSARRPRATCRGRAECDVDPANVLVGTGAKPFLFFGILATCNPGDEVVYPDPGFPIYESAIRWAGATPVPLPLLEERDFAFDLADLRVAAGPADEARDPELAAEPDRGRAVAGGDGARRRRCSRTAAPGSSRTRSTRRWSTTATSRASRRYPGMLERTILLDGLSKTYAMTGWRCGFAAVPEPLVDPLVRFFVNSTSCVPPFVQLAGVAALSGPQDEPRAMVEEFRARRELVVAGLNELPGVSCRDAAGRVLRLPERLRRARSTPTSSPTGCCRRPASRCSPAARSATTARTTSGSATRTRARTSRSPSNGWATSSPRYEGGRVIAPSDADETSAAYFAKTPSE